MCGPFAIPLALVAAGSVAKYFGEKKAEKAQNNTFAAERKRQQSMTDDQSALFKDSLAKTQELADPAAQQHAADAREQSLSAAIAAPQAAYLPGSSSAPSVVADATARSDATSQATSANLAHTLAALGGTTDQVQQIGIGLDRNSGRIGQIAGFKAGSAGVLDAEMKAAAQKGAFLRGIGGLAQSIGSAWLGGSVIGAGGAAGGMSADAAKTIAANPAIF